MEQSNEKILPPENYHLDPLVQKLQISNVVVPKYLLIAVLLLRSWKFSMF